jgi:hypothetical protein
MAAVTDVIAATLAVIGALSSSVLRRAQTDLTGGCPVIVPLWRPKQDLESEQQPIT